MSDVEPVPAEPNKQGGLKDQAPPADTSDDHTGQSEVEEDSDARRSDDDGGMLSEG